LSAVGCGGEVFVYDDEQKSDEQKSDV